MADRLLRGMESVGSLSDQASQYLITLDSVRDDIKKTLFRITRLQARLDPLEEDLDIVHYWLRKLQSVVSRFDRFANLPKAEWPAPEKARATLATLTKMVNWVERAAKGMAINRLPERIVFHTEDIEFFFRLGAPDTV